MGARAAAAGLLTFLCAAIAGPAAAGRAVGYASGYPAGSILISQSARKLYLIVDARTAIAYPVAVARPRQGVDRPRPGRRRNMSSPRGRRRTRSGATTPSCPTSFPGGSPHNPMGARAITLDRDEIAIHGTTRAMRASIGRAASYGCIRMLNEDVIDLFDRVAVGAPVMMTP